MRPTILILNYTRIPNWLDDRKYYLDAYSRFYNWELTYHKQAKKLWKSYSKKALAALKESDELAHRN
jgi:hypothetical protein